MTKPNVYLRFLNLVEAFNPKSNIRGLDSTENQLLNSIMLDDNEGRSVFVGDLIGQHFLGSQATLHGRIKNLCRLGYIELIIQSDARRKRVMPTRLAYKRFDMLSLCLWRAAKEIPRVANS
ncbi:hypothetical protein [Polynucleobacter alcilacus]|uniref:hypothetical protein n=1 Tax=Polynucleobacter alcilacus TaxID=1819739 RepID=UPI001C0E3FC1|nr:hypothetical protein [Polynucleobacter alcilacus]MBU3567249.1 hypothetical protein [Polynucleobacter alcilacus]